MFATNYSIVKVYRRQNSSQLPMALEPELVKTYSGTNNQNITIIHRALIRAEIPSVREPSGLSRDDGKMSDGLTLVPWQLGHSTTWDVTVVHTLAASYVSQSAVQAGSAVTAASVRKSAKYSSLSSSHVFCPVAVEMLGPLVDDAQLFMTEIGRKATLCTADLPEGTFLYQRISVAIQHFNTNSLTVSESPS